jgi:hypothetical protein
LFAGFYGWLGLNGLTSPFPQLRHKIRIREKRLFIGFCRYDAAMRFIDWANDGASLHRVSRTQINRRGSWNHRILLLDGCLLVRGSNWPWMIRKYLCRNATTGFSGYLG